MDLSVALRLLGVVGLVLANAFFVAAEFALVGARKARIRELADRGDRLARSVERALGDIDRAVSGTQVGITAASLGLGWIGEPAVARSLERLMTAMSVQLSPVVLHSVAIVIAFGLITYLHVVLGELAPRSVALLRPEAVSRFVAPPLNAFNRLVAPGIWLVNTSSSLFLRVWGLGEPTATARVRSPEELEMLVHTSRRQGAVEEDEQAMIQGVFELTHTVAREVRTPRPDIVGTPAEATIADILKTAADSGFSRLPVYEGSLDDIVGVVVVKDLLPWIVYRSQESASAREVMREALFVPDTKPVDDLLAELRSRKLHMAIVVDEFAGTDGIVTLEDLIEEIVGEIYDEHDVAQADVAVEPDGRIVIDGGYSFSDLLAKFDLPAAEEEYDTVAGYVIGTLGQIPEVGDNVPIGEAELEVLELNERRITRLELKGVTGTSSTGVAEEGA